MLRRWILSICLTIGFPDEEQGRGNKSNDEDRVIDPEVTGDEADTGRCKNYLWGTHLPENSQSIPDKIARVVHPYLRC